MRAALLPQKMVYLLYQRQQRGHGDPAPGKQPIAEAVRGHVALSPVKALHHAENLPARHGFRIAAVIPADEGIFAPEPDDPVHDGLSLPPVQRHVIFADFSGGTNTALSTFGLISGFMLPLMGEQTV